MICLVDSQILFCEIAGSVGANPIKPYLKWLWLVVQIAIILSKTVIIHFLFMSARTHFFLHQI